MWVSVMLASAFLAMRYIFKFPQTSLTAKKIEMAAKPAK
jgi:hypothetical protein